MFSSVLPEQIAGDDITAVSSTFMGRRATTVNLGFVQDFLFRWAIAFAAGFAISLPAVIISVPVARRIVKRVTAAE